jgi:hypothetical protein
MASVNFGRLCFLREIVVALIALGRAAMSHPAAAGIDFQLVASNIVIDEPAPLFTNGTVSGVLTLAGTVAPGAGFGLADITGFTFDFGGIIVTLAQTQQPGGDITAFGILAANGASISYLDLLYDLPSTVSSCSFDCSGQIEIDTFDNSNFVAIDDPDAVTTSLVEFNAALVAATGVPEPGSLTLLGVAAGGLAAARRRRKS